MTMTNPRVESLKARLRSAAVEPPPRPWRQIQTFAVGGLLEVGFAPDSDLLLVVSSQGRGLIDCLSGERIARDYEPPDDAWYDEGHLRARGIGPLQSEWIRLAGLHGGGLLTIQRDGWSVESIPLDWPQTCLLLVPPRSDIYDPKGRFTKLAVEYSPIAFGFSETGASLVFATSSDLTIFGLQ